MKKTSYTAAELMEVALMCLSNMNPTEPPPPPTIHCRTCKRIVSADEAALVCYSVGHDVIESKDEFAA